MGALADHHRRKLSSASCSRLSEEGRLYENSFHSEATKIAPHIVMLTAAVLIGGALGLAYQHLHESHPGVNKLRMKAEPVVLRTSSGALTRHSMVLQLKDRGVLGAGGLWGGRGGKDQEGDVELDSKTKEQLEELDGHTLTKDDLFHAPKRVQTATEQEQMGSDSLDLLSKAEGDLIQRTYVHQPGEVVAEDEGGGKFVVDDKDRIVYVEEQGAERLLRGLARRRRSLKG